ncbi:hypothetical protein EDD21DRAFT_425512 [Dissophora ornata]|nr:hypothetical protein EDD21DRAFT_425512 [Dissophora ornata]
MEDTQSFRLIGNLDIENIPLDNVNGQNIVYWENIQRVFPGVKYVKNGKVSVNMMKDSHQIRIEPNCIEYCPNVVLDVVLSTTIKHVHQVLKDAQEIKDRLILIQSKTEAILTQNYELHEYTLPRLFIVLHERPTPWDPTTMLRTKFRLHFIFECGEHTNAYGSKIPHHFHLSNHGDMSSTSPRSSSRTLENLKMVNALDFAQSSVDSVTHNIIEGVNYSLAYLEESCSLIQKSSGIDVEGDARVLQHDVGSYPTGVEVLEGVELRRLGSYLEANNSDNLLSNLYHMTTKDGHIKWVCRHHYRVVYQEAHTRRLRDAVKLAESVYDEQLGSIKVTLKSSPAAVEFNDAIGKAKVGVYNLDITLGWDCPRPDLEAFENALKMSNQHHFNHFELVEQLNYEGRSSDTVGSTQTNTTLSTLNPQLN